MIRNLIQKIRGFFQKLFKSDPAPEEKSSEPSVFLYIFPAHNGDTLMIQYVGEDQQNHYIWIDGGLVKSYAAYGQKAIKALQERNESIDLMIVTHVDQDHIGGILAFARDRSIHKEMVKQFWFNSGRLISDFYASPRESSRELSILEEDEGTRSISQGLTLEDFLAKSEKWHDKPILQYNSFEMHGAEISILAPNEKGLKDLNEDWEDEMATTRGLVNTDYHLPLEALALKPEKEDRSVANRSSIAFVFEIGSKRLLMLGDAPSSVIAESLNKLGYSIRKKLKLDAVKLSHHGSKASNTRRLMDLIDCDTYIVSTDGSRHGLPNKEALARLVLHPGRNRKKPITFIFNHDNETLRNIFTKEEIDRHQILCKYPEDGKMGYLLEI